MRAPALYLQCMMDEIMIEFEYADEDEFSFDGSSGEPDVIWAYRDGEQAGYVQFYVFGSRDELEAEIEPDRYGWTVEGPFFQPDEHTGSVLYMADILVKPEHRGSGVYDRLVGEVEKMAFATYCCFTNDRLAERWRRLHQPA